MFKMNKSEIFIELGQSQKPESIFPASACFIAEIDGRKIQDKDSLMKALAAGFRFPAYFGENWDALADCLRSLPDELEGYDVYMLYIRNYKEMLAAFPEERKNLEEVLEDAASFVADPCGKKLAVCLG